MAELTTLGEAVAELVHDGDGGGGLGVASLCIGVGQGLAVVLEGCD
jgi:acetyl-CoA acetyltransferase